MAMLWKETGFSPAAKSWLDGRVKIALATTYALALFLSDSAASLVAAAAIVALAAALLRMPWRAMVEGAAPVYPIAVFLVAYHGVNASALTAFVVAGRVVLLVYASILLVESTSPIELAEALRRLLSPLGRLGVPVRDATTALSIALRFLPMTAEELERVRAAQMSRGAAFEDGGATQRLRAYGGLMIPLFVGLFHRADRLACAMDARCFGACDDPTTLDEHRFKAKDGIVLALGMLLCGAIPLFPNL